MAQAVGGIGTGSVSEWDSRLSIGISRGYCNCCYFAG